MKCDKCVHFSECMDGERMTWPCGSFLPRPQPPAEITTYPAMNETIKDLLRRSEEPMQRYILARIEELERDREQLLARHWSARTCYTCGHGGDGEEIDDDGHCWLHNGEAGYKQPDPKTGCAEWTPKAPAQAEPRTRFERIKACATPEEMVIEINANARHFCPRDFYKKSDTCAKPCGECITTWLREEVQT